MLSKLAIGCLLAISGVVISPVFAQTPEELYRLGEFGYYKLNYKNAIMYLDAALRKRTDFTQAYYLRGVCKLEIGDPISAAEDFIRTLKLDSRNAQAYSGLSSAYNSLGDYSLALANAIKAYTIDSKLLAAYHNAAIALLGQKKYDRCIATCNDILAKDSTSSSSLLTRGEAYEALGDYSRAIADYELALKINSRDAKGYVLSGNAKMNLDLYQEALDNFSAALSISDQLSDAWIGRAISKTYLNQVTSALSDLNELLKINSRHLSARVLRGDIHRSLGNMDIAMEDYARVLAIDPGFSFAYFARANAYYQLKQYDKALADYNEAIARNQDNFAAYNNRGNLFAKLSDYARALVDYRRAIGLNAKDSDLLYNTSLSHYRLGSLDSSHYYLKRALEINRQHAPTHRLLAELAVEARQDSVALTHLDQLPDFVQAEAEMLLLRGEILQRLCDYAGAERSFRRLITADTNSVEGHWGLGNVLLDQRKDSLAAPAFRHVLNLNPTRVDAWYSLAYTYRRLHLLQQSLEACNQGLQLDPNSGLLLTERGLVHFIEQRFELACADWRRARALGDTRADELLKTSEACN